MFKKKNYIFTNKKNSPKAIMSTILGVIAVVSLVLVLYLTYRRGGQAAASYGMTGLLITVFGFVGLMLGIVSRMEKDMFYFFSYAGIFLNGLALAGISFVLYAGAYGI